ncbi:MAG: hypothetical protein KQI78_14515 [Deltaproteobacteria bacterium]|nr:hypothetical protein [Deltaproteobacteria bacterium]
MDKIVWLIAGILISFAIAFIIELIKDFWIRRRKVKALIAMLESIWSEIDLGRKRTYTIIRTYYNDFLKILLKSKVDKDIELVEALFLKIGDINNIVNHPDPNYIDYKAWQCIVDILTQKIDYINERDCYFREAGQFRGPMSTSRIYTFLWSSLCSEICSQVGDQNLIRSLHKVYYHFDLINFNMESPGTRIHGIAMARTHLLGIEKDCNNCKTVLKDYTRSLRKIYILSFGAEHTLSLILLFILVVLAMYTYWLN